MSYVVKIKTKCQTFFTMRKCILPFFTLVLNKPHLNLNKQTDETISYMEIKSTSLPRDSAKRSDIGNDCEIGSAEGNTRSDINTREFALG